MHIKKKNEKILYLFNISRTESKKTALLSLILQPLQKLFTGGVQTLDGDYR